MLLAVDELAAVHSFHQHCSSVHPLAILMFSRFSAGCGMRFCSQSKLYYIGFSQGTAQAFAAFSSNPDLLAKVNLFVALSPAVRANHLSKSLLLSLVQANLRCVDGGPALRCVAGEHYQYYCAASKYWSVIG